MLRKNLLLIIALCFYLISSGYPGTAQAASSALLGWNNLGMHCMDSDYSVFSILPPYNTIEAQLIVGGKLVKSSTGYTITYEAVADPDGSMNSTSVGKGNWNLFESIIFGVPSSYTADNGLVGWNMPGAANVPQPMKFENFNVPAPGLSVSANWFRAEGIPLTPYDDNGKKNNYPLMRIVARDAANSVIATSDIVLPVSDEMDCSSCHGSGTQTKAQPVAGWVFASPKDRDYRLNILRLHDEQEFSKKPALYAEALAAKGFDVTGLYTTAVNGKPMMCAACHASEALGAPSFSGTNGTVSTLTSAVHTNHAEVKDPVLNMNLNDSNNRDACYRCHPGSETKCLRGAMGSAVAADGSMAMQCQSCHGNMARVGSSSRVGWLMQPNCQACHTGTATNNNGQIRYNSVFDANDQVRVPVDQTFATTPDTPAAGLSLYRFSAGHGGLQCSACHGSTHAEFPAAHRNDNIRNIQLQGHGGTTVECTACHDATLTTSANGGPHGMHSIDLNWAKKHKDSVKSLGVKTCQTCHGTDDRGTVLSRALADRNFGTGKAFFRGATIGCYSCHQGPSNDKTNSSVAPVVSNVSAQTSAGQPVSMTLPVTGTNAVVRIISQPANGTVGLTSNSATYYPGEGFTGTDTFTFAAYDGAKNSNLGTGTIAVGTGTSTAPAIYGFSPGSGEVGTAVTITGTNFTGASAVAFNGTSAPSFSVVSGTQISVTVPSGATSGTISVATPGGSATSSSSFTVVSPSTVVPPPAISSFTPTSGKVGATVTITGSNFSTATKVTFNGVNAIFMVNSDTTIVTGVPTGATTGKISVTTAGGTTTSGTSFSVVSPSTVVPPPAISSFTPTSGKVGTAVTITGSNFSTATKVTFNGVNAIFMASSNTTIVTNVPTGATTGKISVTTAGGTTTSGTSFSVGNTTASTRIQSFSPTSGPVGTKVTVSGTNLGSVTSAKVGKVNAQFTVKSENQIIITVPKEAKTGRISVTSAGKTVSSTSSFTVSKQKNDTHDD